MNTVVTVLVGLLVLNFVSDAVALAIMYRKRDVYLPRFRMLLRNFLGVDHDVAVLADRIGSVERQQEEFPVGDGCDSEECQDCSCCDCDGFETEEAQEEAEEETEEETEEEVEPREPTTEEKLSQMIQDKLAGKKVGLGAEAALIFEAFRKLSNRK